MTANPEQYPPFLICVPINHSAAWPGLAAREIEALLDDLGNRAGGDLTKALDDSGVIHFLSMSVVWIEGDTDPPVLVADIAADGTPTTIIAALGREGLALPHARLQGRRGRRNRRCASETPGEKLGQSRRGVLRPFQRRVTGLAFQGTPGLTVARIKEDERLAIKAKTCHR